VLTGLLKKVRQSLWTVPVVITLAYLVILGIQWSLNRDTPAPVESWSVPEPAKPVASIEKVPVERPVVIRAYRREDAVARLKLPEVGVGALRPDEEVVDAVRVQRSERPTEVVAITDAVTGETRTLTRQIEYPTFSLDSKAMVSLDYGVSSRGGPLEPASFQPEARLSLRYDVVQVKGVNLGVTGTVTSLGDTFVGFGVNYRW
jgi:hypothetical protein